ncbi:MAG: HXXEE domain-containing protein [Spirochaetes bacterium]|nr:HXXEE domain-containing protein [Spirochaetota bacterium]
MNAKIRDALVPGLIVLAWAAIYSFKGISTALTFGLSMVAAYVLYLLTNYRRMPDPARVLPLYLVALCIQCLHLLEEFVTRFYVRFPAEIYHSTPFTAEEFITSQMVLFGLLILGALALYRGWKIPMVFVWFFVIMLQFVNAVQHPLYAIMRGGYFPGLFTSFPGWILGPILFKRLWEVRGYASSRG